MLTNSHRKRFAIVSLILTLLMFPLISSAHNKVIVVPMSGDDTKPLSNIVTVAKKNGDFTDPVAAMASITDASSTNPYLLVIAPGIYEIGQQLTLKDYVDIAGSGKNITQLVGDISHSSLSSDAALIDASNFSDWVSIRDLTIINHGRAQNYTTGIHMSGPVELSGIEIRISGGINQTGIVSNNGLVVDDSEISVNGGVLSNIGIRGGGALNNSEVRVSGTGNQGIVAQSIVHSLRIQNSLIHTGSTSSNALNATGNSSNQLILNTRIRGVVSGSNFICHGVFSTTSTFNLLNSNCQ